MPRVNIENFIDYHRTDIRKALMNAVEKVAPELEVDRNKLYKAFLREVRRRCSTWVDVKDQDLQVP